MNPSFSKLFLRFPHCIKYVICLPFLSLPFKPLEFRVGRSYATDAITLKMDKFWYVEHMEIIVNHSKDIQPEDYFVYHKVF